MNTEIVLAPPRPRRLQIRRPGFLANGPNLILERRAAVVFGSRPNGSSLTLGVRARKNLKMHRRAKMLVDFS